tara:strand:+ start:21473 stop:22132 length:660 start_codon:yes stop_codon:yes gene_type:complete
MVPARKGSERLTKKNYLKIGQYTVLEIAILKAKKCDVFDRIVVNTDDPELENISSNLGVDFYLRPDYLASSNATSDQVVLDFFNSHEGDKIFWLNTVSPLQTLGDIKNFVKSSDNKNWKSAVSYNSTQVHAIFDHSPINFDWVDGFARTQDLRPVQCFNYAMMGWSREMVDSLIKGQLFDKDTFLVESSIWSSFLLKNKDDMNLIKTISKTSPDQGLSF